VFLLVMTYDRDSDLLPALEFFVDGAASFDAGYHLWKGMNRGK
jgi:hypothetical protein